jgi:acetolactate synthase I/II/III large subunit
MIKVSDYIIRHLRDCFGIEIVFMVSGGGSMHLTDSIGASGIKYVCCLHEQACAIAAEGYYRATGKVAAVCITSGPGGTNCVTGVYGQWTDSIPVIYLSGQVNYNLTIDSCRQLGLRQLGDQEVDIISIVKSITKYAEIVKHGNEIKYHIDRAMFLATQGRPGPIWLDIPLNVQAEMIDENQLFGINVSQFEVYDNGNMKAIYDLIQKSKRPLIIAGNGLKMSGQKEHFLMSFNNWRIPTVTTFNAFDLIPSDHPLYAGRIGQFGDIAGNTALQKCDLLICLGTRNNVRQVGYAPENFAKNAIKIVVDIDKAELNKPTIKPDIAINASVEWFITKLDSETNKNGLKNFIKWQIECSQNLIKYPVLLPEYRKVKNKVNPYVFIEALTKIAGGNLIVGGNGTACVVLFQAAVIYENSRIFINSGCASMGYDLPAAIGAAMSGEQVICLAGDGSIQMNIQELATIKALKLPIKIFYLNNEGYVSIKQTQDNNFGRRCGCDEKSGMHLPNIHNIADAYGIKYYKLFKHSQMHDVIDSVFAKDEPVICEVRLQSEYKFYPKISRFK